MLMLPVFEKDIFENTSLEIVSKTSDKLLTKYKVQAYPREINLFYLKDDIRNRIVQIKDQFVVHDTDIVFTKDELKNELRMHPERFSPNVILRGLMQETILPNIAFIGGGGEIAYWLELKELFHFYKVPFPVLIVRNSFLIIEKKYHELITKLNLNAKDIFKGEENLLNEIVKEKTPNRLQLDEERFHIRQHIISIKKLVSEIDVTLAQHAEALEKRSDKKLEAMEKKMLRAEKRKFEEAKNQLSKVIATLSPAGALQERTENFMLFYSKFGSHLFKILYDNSLTIEQKFCLLVDE